jgi:RNA-dependent RNA polymerase
LYFLLQKSTQISTKLNKKVVPSAFQIRLGGCKGVVAVAPDLGDVEVVQIRPSMKKYESDHKKLEVMQTTKPGNKFLEIVCGFLCKL